MISIKNYLKFLVFALLTMSLTGCAVLEVEPVTTIVKDDKGKVISSKTEYVINHYSADNNGVKLSNAPSAIAGPFQDLAETNRFIDSECASDGIFGSQCRGVNRLPAIVKYVTQKSEISNQTTSIQQDISSTGNSPTQEPLPQTVCNTMINGRCDTNTVTGVTAALAVGVIAGATAAVVTTVNNEANKKQQEQKNNNTLTTILAIQNQNKSCRTETYYDGACFCMRTREVCN